MRDVIYGRPQSIFYHNLQEKKLNVKLKRTTKYETALRTLLKVFHIVLRFLPFYVLLFFLSISLCHLRLNQIRFTIVSTYIFIVKYNYGSFYILRHFLLLLLLLLQNLTQKLYYSFCSLHFTSFSLAKNVFDGFLTSSF